MKLFLITAKRNYNINGAKITKGMTVEIQTNLSSPFNNNGKEVVDALVRKYGIDNSRLSGLSATNFDVKKLS